MKYMVKLFSGEFTTKRLIMMIFVTLPFTITLGILSDNLKTNTGADLYDAMLFGYGYEEFQTNLIAFGQHGRDIYIYRIFPLDMIYPLIYSYTAFVAWRLATKGLENRLINAVSYLPLLIIVLDYTENIRIVLLLGGAIEITEISIAITSGATLMKWASIALFLVLLLAVMLGRKLIRLSSSG